MKIAADVVTAADFHFQHCQTIDGFSSAPNLDLVLEFTVSYTAKYV